MRITLDQALPQLATDLQKRVARHLAERPGWSTTDRIMTDSRAGGYIARFGRSSWELDALEPSVLTELIRDTVAEYRDEELWAEAVKRLESEREILTQTYERWDEVVEFLNGDDG